jgi:hypothetical protein
MYYGIMAGAVRAEVVRMRESVEDIMQVELIPASFVAAELTKKIMESTFDINNEWFFSDGAFNASSLDTNCNTWLFERFVAISEGKICAYFDGAWQRPLDIIAAFRTINFTRKSSPIFVKALFKYFDYLFVNRGCYAFNWTVASQNENALEQYERFIKNYCGHKVGQRTRAQKSYTGKISDIFLYEFTREEYFDWKSRNFAKRIQI